MMFVLAWLRTIMLTADSTNPADLFGAPIARKAQKQSIIKHLEREAKGCDVLALWLDCDREGENICFEVIDVVLDCLRCPKEYALGRVYRAKFSALGDSDLLSAFAKLGRPDVSI